MANPERLHAGRFHPLLRILVYLVVQVLALAPWVIITKPVLRALQVEKQSPAGLGVSLAVQTLMLLSVLLVSRWAMRWMSGVPFSCFGLARGGGWTRRLAVGAAVGTLAPALIGLVGVLSAAATFQPRWSGTPGLPSLLVLNVLSMVLVALFEECLFRGYLFQELGRWKGPWLAMSATFVVFGALHLTNPGASAAGVLATGAAGVALYATLQRTGDLWMAIGFHFAWNTVLSVLLGFTNGGEAFPGRLFDVDLRGPAWLWGGSFGPEASLFAFATFAALTGVAVRMTAPAGSAQAPAGPAPQRAA